MLTGSVRAGGAELGVLLVPQRHSIPMSRRGVDRKRLNCITDCRGARREVGNEGVDEPGPQLGSVMLREFDHGEEDDAVPDHHAQYHG